MRSIVLIGSCILLLFILFISSYLGRFFAPPDVSSWIAKHQIEDGCFIIKDGKKIPPRDVNYAMMGILSRPKYLKNVKKWMDFYIQQKRNPNSTILSDPSFLTLVWNFYKKTNDFSWIIKNFKTLEDRAKTIVSFQREDGLILPSKKEDFKNLVRVNCECFRGLFDFSHIMFDIVQDRQKGLFYLQKAKSIRKAILGQIRSPSILLEQDQIKEYAWIIITKLIDPSSTTANSIFKEIVKNKPSQMKEFSEKDLAVEGLASVIMCDFKRSKKFIKAWEHRFKEKIINPKRNLFLSCGIYLQQKDYLKNLSKMIGFLNDPYRLCLKFIEKNLSTPWGGIYSSYQNIHPPSTIYGVNHEVSSESLSLILNLAAITGDKKIFDKNFMILIDFFLDRGASLIIWKVTPLGYFYQNPVYNTFSDASIDTLKIINSLIIAYSRWKEPLIIEVTRSIAEGLLNHHVIDDKLMDWFCWKDDFRETGNTITLCYLDLLTMKKLENFNPVWKKVLSESKRILLKGQAKTGLFFNSYIPLENRFIGEEDSIILQAKIAEHLAEFGISFNDKVCVEAAKRFLSFVKDKYHKSGKIYGRYNIFNGRTLNNIEDIAAYAIIARVAFLLNDLEFTRKLVCRNILPFQIKNPREELFGAFSWKTTDTNAYVNLQVLLTLALVKKEGYFIF